MSAVFKLSVAEAIRKAHKDILSNRDTYTLGGAILLGDTSIVDDIPTACTNGRDKFYGEKFMESLPQEERVGIVMHEAGHVLLRHIPRHTDLMAEDAKLANAAMDYKVNGFIRAIPGYGTWFKLSQGHLFDPRFDTWSVRDVYNYFKKGKNPDQPDQPSSQPQRSKDKDGNESVTIDGESFDLETDDTHDSTMLDDMDDDEKEELEKKINQAIQEAAVLAGAMGADVPKEISELLSPEVDWREETQEFFQSAMRGNDEYTFRQFNRKRLADDLYRPSTYNERLGNIIIANDTSGSIDDKAMGVWMDWMAKLCEQCTPDEVRVLWWDTAIKGDQTLVGDYSTLREVLDPRGGGGTEASCIARYIKDKRIDADCIVVFTDGYTESNIVWDIDIPTLWIVTENSSFKAPKGRVVKFK
jgi:predicted metal-dependent peptidase